MMLKNLKKDMPSSGCLGTFLSAPNFTIQPFKLVLFSLLQIQNIKNIIHITTQKLVELNEKFGKQQNPPSIYIQVSDHLRFEPRTALASCSVLTFQEYEGLTTRIHELQLREQQLQDQLGSEQSHSPSSTEDEGDGPMTSSDYEGGGTAFPIPPLSDSTLSAQDNTPMVTPNSSSGNLLSSPKQTRSPLSSMIKAYLPNQQKTCVSLCFSCLLCSYCSTS